MNHLRRAGGIHFYEIKFFGQTEELLDQRCLVDAETIVEIICAADIHTGFPMVESTA